MNLELEYWKNCREINFINLGSLPTAGDDYLNRSLRQLFVSDLCARNIRHQTFVAMPLTTLPSTLDLRGPYAMTDEEVGFFNTR